MAPALHKYPGINLPLRYVEEHWDGEGAGIEFYRCGSFPGAGGSISELLQVREVGMLVLMDRLTDKPNWNKKVFDDSIVAKWRHEALTQNGRNLYKKIVPDHDSIPMPDRTRIINKAAFDYCIAELKRKAAHFEGTGVIFTPNSSQGMAEVPCFNTVIKADCLVTKKLQTGLNTVFERFRTDQGAEPDWHPGSKDMVQDLVHPSMYPFVYGESKFIPEELVGVTDAIDKWSGKGDTVQPLLEDDNEDRTAIDGDYWSETYQWLPANLTFQEDGSVHFTSYINNLHPQKHTETCTLFEKLIATAIPAWEHVLSGKATTESDEAPDRLEYPPEVTCYNEDDAWDEVDSVIIAEYEAKRGPIEYDEDAIPPRDDDDGDEDEESRVAREILLLKWRELRDPIFMDPLEFEPYTYTIEQTLRERFKDTGLQVIVKMALIELTLKSLSSLRIEGQMNEHIVATALYYLDSQNVTPMELSFRMATDQEQTNLRHRVEQGMFEVYERIYGTGLGVDFSNKNVQPYGRVATPEGRLLAFPNVFQHRIASFSLQDRTKPGHRRFVTLWLVDPLQRIISTANVPPQQFDWWAEAVIGSEHKTLGGMPPEVFQLLLEQGAAKAVRPSKELLESTHNRLPTEVMEMVRQEARPAGLMTADQARQHRLALMKERSDFMETVEHNDWTN